MAEMRLMTPAVAMASTTLPVLAPGSSCLPPGPCPLPSSPCSVTSVTCGAPSISSLASTWGVAASAPSTAPCDSAYGSPGPSPGPGYPGRGLGPGTGARTGPALGLGQLPGMEAQDMGSRVPGRYRYCNGWHVQALGREKASLAADNAALRQQVDQLEELVGLLLAERERPRGQGEGAGSFTQGAEVGEVGFYDTDGSYGRSPSLPMPLLEPGDWQQRGDRPDSAGGCCEDDEGVNCGSGAVCGSPAEGGSRRFEEEEDQGQGGNLLVDGGLRDVGTRPSGSWEAPRECVVAECSAGAPRSRVVLEAGNPDRGRCIGAGEGESRGRHGGAGGEEGLGATMSGAGVAVVMEGGPLGPPGPLFSGT
ncbi:hypothetical protein VOLCADRAFT_86601 [Volvox carteri f. nagariensis]|uniref:Uncharacterized protein n=1 Tax=Volvox carteri f. nagariensis TaxID=3068 RepID=D8TJ38_VOLCA|nr:uncharacterized protein VOLCADRAFT_86601 [Volvox carteri f. nagariensis]EFJ52470.1 hypothetical protein VOLCADRAFT_86601 [Volvox carteri f. nagariensis]|eukprot:XP_002946543.1 hypothetical protein VOLCADRAFT_86601 [Volvox carteri f. nagariensis]